MISKFSPSSIEIKATSIEIEAWSSTHNMATSSDNNSPIDNYQESDNNLRQVSYLKQESDIGNKFQEYEERKRKMELVLLDHFAELYTEKRELFKKIFPGPQSELTEVLKKVDKALTLKRMTGNTKVSAMSRSLSVGSPRTPVGNGHCDSPIKLDRFKVKTINVDIVQEGEQDHKQ